MSGTCHDACQASADCPTGQSCVKTDNATLCQLPAEADCSTTLSCSGGLVCASDLRCRAACQSRTDCTSEQMCVSGVCAAPSELDVNGQLPQKGPSPIADGGADVRASAAGGQGADVAGGVAEVGSKDSSADLPVGAADARGQDVGASDLANPATDAPQSTQPDSGPGTGSDAKTADAGGGTPDADAADRSPFTPDSSGRGDAVPDVGAVDVSPMTPASLSASPSSLDFGSVTTGQSSSAQSFAITNTGQQTSGAITVKSDNTDFVVQTGGAFDCVSGKTTLAPGTACTVHIVFSPKLAIAVTGSVAFSATPGGSSGVSVSGTSACSSDYLRDGTGTCVPYAGVVWTQTNSPQANWVSVASSSDGTKLIAASDYIYTSADSGATWTQRGSVPQYWQSVASSSDGTKLVAVTDEYIYTSADSGLIWSQAGTQQYGGVSVASSSDGTKLIAAFDSIYTSADSGVT